MSGRLVRLLDGDVRELNEGTVSAFANSLRGDLLRPEDPGYDDARKIWNGMIDKRPALIARCTGAADVIDAVRFAREHDLLVSVRGGGHNIAGTALCDGGLMIDLQPMQGIHVEPQRRRVRVQPGVTLGALDRETQPFGLVVPAGIVSETGVSGLTLGGGFGWLTRKWGYTSDWLRSADIVTASGEYLTVSPDRHPDLFWSLTGGGGNFGIVTSYEFEAVPLGPTVMAGLVFHPLSEAGDVMRLFQELTAEAPDELTYLLITRMAPPLPFIPQEHHGAPVVGIAMNYAGPVEDAEPYARRLKKYGTPLVDTIQPKPFRVHQSFLDAGQPSGRHYYWKSDYSAAFSLDMGERMVEHTRIMPSPLSATLMMHLGGQAKRVAPGASAVAHRDAEFIFAIQASWLDAADTGDNVAWARTYFDAVQPFSSGGTYMNFLNQDDPQDRIRQAYDTATYDRLVEVKVRYDPGNMFRSNKNIQPLVPAVQR
jgi:FAD/FMN-containing dehydrogenase